MLNGMKFIKTNGSELLGIKSDDDDNYPFDTEDGFDENSIHWASEGYSCYYFGSSSDGAMKTGKMQVAIDGDNYNFNFGKSGSLKGAGKTGEDDKKYYNSGKLMAAGKDEKYQVIYPAGVDASKFVAAVDDAGITKLTNAADILDKLTATQLSQCGLSATKLAQDKYGDLCVFYNEADGTIGLNAKDYMVVNTTGTVSKSSAKNKDGNDVYYKLHSGKIVAVFSEN